MGHSLEGIYGTHPCNTPMNRGAVNRFTLGLTWQCVQVYVCVVYGQQ